MKKFLTVMLTLALLLGVSTALAAGKLQTSQEAVYVAEGYSNVYVYVYAEVTNAGDKNVQYSDGLFEVYDADGNVLESTTYLSCYPEYLAPGEVGYLYGYLSIKDTTDTSVAADYMLNVTGKGSNENPTHYLPAEAVYEKVETSYSSYDYVYSTVTNDLDSTVREYRTVIALYDAEGNLKFVDAHGEGTVGIPAGNKAEVSFSLSYNDAMEYLVENEGYNFADVRTLAYTEIEE